MCLVLDFFDKVFFLNLDLKFYIYGLDVGDECVIKVKVKELGILRLVYFMGEKDFGKYFLELFNCSFFINLLLWEGMVIFVIEVM